MRRLIPPLCLTALLVVAAEVVFPGCGTMNNGASQGVLVKSRPAGAEVFVDDRRIGAAPVRTDVSRWGFHKVRIKAAGFEPVEFPLVKNIWGLEGLNWFFPPGFVIDLATGAVFEQALPANPPAGVGRGRWEKGDPQGWVSLVITAELHPREHGREVGRMKRAPAPSR